MNLLSFGEIVWDIFGDEKYLGGAPLNFAAYCTALGGKAWLVSAVGADEYGRMALDQIKKFGINSAFVSVLPGKQTGKCFVDLNKNAFPSYNIADDAAYDYIHLPESKNGFDVIAFGTLALRRENNRRVLKRILDNYMFSEIFADLNIRKPFYSKESILLCLNNATIVKVSDEEIPAVSETIGIDADSAEKFVFELCEKFTRINIAVVTKGKNGSICFSRSENKFFYCDAQTTEVVSTVGAGDSFGAAFLSRYTECKNCRESLGFASIISSIVCSREETVSQKIYELIKTAARFAQNKI